MSGQFEQRRLARPSFQLDVLDAFVGEEQLRRRAELARAWRELVAARRRRDELARPRRAAAERLAELRELVARTEGLEAGAEERLLAERERLRHVTELAEAAAARLPRRSPRAATAPGAAELVARGRAARSTGVAGLAPELGEVAAELADAEIRLREAASALRAFLASLEAEPGRLDAVEDELERIAEAKRRFRADSSKSCSRRRPPRRPSSRAVEAGVDPLAGGGEALAAAEARVDELAARASRGACRGGGRPSPTPSPAELQGSGMGDGEFRVELAAAGARRRAASTTSPS